MIVKFKKLLPGAKMPLRASEHAAGYDLYSYSDRYLLPGHGAFIETGIAVEIPVGYECQIRPRSGLATKHHVIIPNAPGTIDSDYRGEIKVYLLNLSIDPVTISSGERIAQAVFAKHEVVTFEEVNDLGDTNRGTGGFGSTGTS